MDPGQRLTRKLFRLWRDMRAPRSLPRPNAARVEEQRARFTLLATLLAGEPLEILAADDGPGAQGPSLLLPSSIDLYPEHDRNAEAYLYRIAFSVGARARGFALDPSGLDDDQRLLALLLTAKVIEAALEREYPAIAALRARLVPALCASRPPIAQATLHGVLEALVRTRLSGKAPDAERNWPGELRAWWQQALAIRVQPAELRAETLRLHAGLRACTRSARGRPLPGVVIWGELPAPQQADAERPLDTGEPTRTQRNQPARTLELRRALRLRRAPAKPREDRPLFHAFEKIETAEEYRGESATPDAEQHIERMDDALSDLSLATVVRTGEDPRQLARADVVLDPAQVDTATRAPDADTRARVYRYPEWDYRKRRYLPDHCTVLAQDLAPVEPAEPALLAARAILARHRRQVDDVRMHLLRGLFRRTVRNRQPEGPEVDVEAMVERHADLRAGRSPPERLFLAGRKTPREIAVLVLLDTSFSTDAWIEGRRVLDIEIESLLVLAAAFEGYLEQEIGVAAFHSRTRNEVRFDVLKRFGDGWARLRQLAPGLAPQGYTRIGAAIRHASALLEGERARSKLLLLVSDGKPTDYDRYEGRYGFEDVAMAVRDAAASQVRTFGLAIEKEAKFHLARMLGPGAYRILPRTELLPHAMAEVFVRLWTG